MVSTDYTRWWDDSSRFRNTTAGWKNKPCPLCDKVTVHNREGYCLECGNYFNENKRNDVIYATY